MERNPNSMLAAWAYLPLGGFQVIYALGGSVLIKDKFVKFHCVQALAYWLLLLISILPFFKIVDMTIGLGNSMIIVIAYIAGLFFIVPIILSFKAIKGRAFYLPFIGKPIAKIVGFENAGSGAQA